MIRVERRHHSAGFTLLELMVAMGLVSILMTMVVGHVLGVQRGYFTDVVRTRINSNLRSAMDILSMNIRQSGENLPYTFPAVLLVNGTGTDGDRLTLRRSLVPEVLTLCTASVAGATQLSVSSTAVSNSACVRANVATSHTVFQNTRTANGGSMRIYIYNTVSKTGEFFDFTAGGLTSGSSGYYYLTTSALSAAYPILTSNIYVLEEYHFQYDPATHTLDAYIDGTSEVLPVAFSITGFQVNLQMDTSTTLTALAASTTTHDWKDIEQIQVTLSGQERYHGRDFTSSITSEYFPRNVLSYD